MKAVLRRIVRKNTVWQKKFLCLLTGRIEPLCFSYINIWVKKEKAARDTPRRQYSPRRDSALWSYQSRGCAPNPYGGIVAPDRRQVNDFKKLCVWNFEPQVCGYPRGLNAPCLCQSEVIRGSVVSLNARLRLPSWHTCPEDWKPS